MQRKITLGLVLGLSFVSAPSGAGWFGPSNFEECILDGMKGISSNLAAEAVARACRSKFPLPPPTAEEIAKQKEDQEKQKKDQEKQEEEQKRQDEKDIARCLRDKEDPTKNQFLVDSMCAYQEARRRASKR